MLYRDLQFPELNQNLNIKAFKRNLLKSNEFKQNAQYNQ